MDYGLQMSTLYAIKDIEEAFTRVAALGYKSAELYGYGKRTPEQLRRIMDRVGLDCIATHGGAELYEEDFDAACREYETLGCRNVVIAWADLSSEEKCVEFAARVNKLIPRMKAAGYDLHFHNHASEFQINPDGSCAHQFLVDNTDLKFEIDIYWAFVGGADPRAVIKRLADRVSLIHLKDGDSARNGLTLGSGGANVADVHRLASELGINMIVESDAPDTDGITEAEVCLKYLRSLEG